MYDIKKTNLFWLLLKIKGKFMPKELHISLKKAISGEVENDYE